MSKRTLLLTLLFLLLISLPYLIAANLAGPDRVFGGFLLNPQDGNTYLAKMYEGWRGEWRFTLPFTAQPGQGAYLFLLYFFLGHLARWTGIPLIWVYHLTRVICAALLLLALLRFYRRYSPGPPWDEWAFAAAIFCLGLGWLLLPVAGLLLPGSHVPADFWVAEAFPFLSAFVNPHFALSLALLLWLLTLPDSKPDSFLQKIFPHHAVLFKTCQVLFAGLLLSLLSPFGVVLGVMVLAGQIFLDALRLARNAGDGLSIPVVERIKVILACLWRPGSPEGSLLVRFGALVCGGLPFLLYYVWITGHDPQLASWNAQNQTLTPPAWDVALALSPFLLLALPAAWGWLRRLDRQAELLLIWAVIGLAFIYFPFSLQRRFMMGLFVPLVGLAAHGLHGLMERFPRGGRLLSRLTIPLALPSTLLILALGVFGARSGDPTLYQTRGEADALQWIAAKTPPHALILASPQMGLLIPAYTGRRVIYGHPYETVDAEAEKAAVESYFQGSQPFPADFLAARGVDYVFYGPREHELGGLPSGLPDQPVYTHGDVIIYKIAGP